MTHSSERAAQKNSLRFGGLMACAIVLCASANPVFAAAMQEPNSGPEVAAAATPPDNAVDDMASAQNAKTDGSTDTDAANSTNNSDATSNTDAAAQQQFSAPPVFAAPVSGMTPNNLTTGAVTATSATQPTQVETQPAAAQQFATPAEALADMEKTQSLTPPSPPPSTPNPIMGSIIGFNSATAHPGTLEGFVFVPQQHPSSAPAATRVHTNYRLLLPTAMPDFKPVTPAQALQNLNANLSPQDLFPTMSPAINTPASLACVYNLAPQPSYQPAGCNPLYTSVNPSGGGGAIALVDPYDHPSMAADLDYFSRYFNLPLAQFQVIYAGGPWPYISGSTPEPSQGDWDGETHLDVEWAHAMAPSAKIFLVESNEDTIATYSKAVQAAQYLVSHNGGGEISMSIGGAEYALSDAKQDLTFAGAPNNVVQLAASGDAYYGAFTNYPSASPYVVSVGGTIINRDSNGSFISETTWDNGSGGVSAYEARPSYQDSLATIVGNFRGTPDIAMLASPETGAPVYLNGSWTIGAGTSLATPLAAGVLNLAASNAGIFPSQSTLMATLYANGASGTDSRDISIGACDNGESGIGYDLCTGWGSLISYPYSTATHAATHSCPPESAGGKGIDDVSIGRQCSKSIYAQ